MDFLCAQVGDILSAGPGSNILSSLQASVLVNGIPLAVVGSPVHDHGGGSHNAAVLSTGSLSFKINGLAVAFTGSLASCGHVVVGTAPVTVTG